MSAHRTLQINDLNDDVLLVIISSLNFADLNAISRVSKRFHALALKEMKKRSTLVCTSDIDSISEPKDSDSVFNNRVAISVHYSRLLQLFYSHLHNIRNLCLCECEGVDNSNVHLIAQHLPNVSCLWFSQIPVNDNGLKQLFRCCKSLRELVLHRIDCDGSCFNELPALNCFRVRYCRNIRGKCIHKLSPNLNDTLEEFSYHAFPYSGFDIEKFANECGANFNKLKTLKLFVPTVASLPALNLLTKLEHLSLNINRNISHDIKLLNPFKNITTLWIEFMHFITDGDLSQLVARFSNVKNLNLIVINNSSDFTETIAVIMTLKKLKHLTLFFSVINDDCEAVNEVCLRPLLDCSNLDIIKIGYLNASSVENFAKNAINVMNRNEERKMTLELFSKEILHQNFETPQNLTLKIHGNLNIEAKYVEYQQELNI